jgi:hypothetical protein
VVDREFPEAQLSIGEESDVNVDKIVRIDLDMGSSSTKQTLKTTTTKSQKIEPYIAHIAHQPINALPQRKAMVPKKLKTFIDEQKIQHQHSRNQAPIIGFSVSNLSVDSTSQLRLDGSTEQKSRHIKPRPLVTVTKQNKSIIAKNKQALQGQKMSFISREEYEKIQVKPVNQQTKTTSIANQLPKNSTSVSDVEPTLRIENDIKTTQVSRTRVYPMVYKVTGVNKRSSLEKN